MNAPEPPQEIKALVGDARMVTIETGVPSAVPRPGETSACAAIGRLHKWKDRGSEPLMGLDKNNPSAPPKFSGSRVTVWRCYRCGQQRHQQ